MTHITRNVGKVIDYIILHPARLKEYGASRWWLQGYNPAGRPSKDPDIVLLDENDTEIKRIKMSEFMK